MPRCGLPRSDKVECPLWVNSGHSAYVSFVPKHLVFSFLTTDASLDVAPIHPDATPVLLLDRTAREQWMTAP